MIKVTWINTSANRNGGGEFGTEQEANNWIATNTQSNAWGKPERWLPDFLEGVETRQITTGNILTSEGGLEYAETITEYLHPAEYTYEIIEEDLAVVKARKIKELSLECEHKNPYLHGDLAYRIANVAMGKYIAEGKKTKEDQYKADFIAVSNVLTTELERCTLLVNSATTEQEVIAVTFTL